MLQERQKWFHPRRKLTVGDTVIVADESTPRSIWAIARITDFFFLGKNVFLRHFRVKIKTSALKKPIPWIWKQFKDAKNKANNSVKKAKRKYFSESLDANISDPRKTWRLINELQSRQSKSTKVSQVKTGNQVFTSPGDIAEAFNNHFTNIGQSLAQEIPSSEIDPLAYVNPVDGVFSFQRINVQKVIKLLKAIDESKATGLDKIPNRLLKIAADVVAPS